MECKSNLRIQKQQPAFNHSTNIPNNIYKLMFCKNNSLISIIPQIYQTILMFCKINIHICKGVYKTQLTIDTEQPEKI